MSLRTALVAEQLRRPVPGGTGTCVRGLVKGLVTLAHGQDVTLVASRTWPHPDPLGAPGLPLQRIALPSKLLVAA